MAELQRQVASLTARLEQVSEKLKAEELPVTSVDFGHEDYLSDISFLSSEDKEANASAESAVASVEMVPVKEAPEEEPADELTAESVEETGGAPEGEVETVSEDDKEGVPVENFVENLTEEPVNEPVEHSAELPVDESVEDSVEGSAEASVGEPIEEPVNEFVDVPVEDPLEGPVDCQEADPVGEPTAEEDLPEDDFPEDGFSLFGDLEPEETKTVKPARSRKSEGASKGKSPEWMTAMPGAAVKDIRSAISLNDRVMFISTLFREDSLLYQDVVSNINGMESFDSAVKYLSDTFPEWDKESESVYRFMMAVRRKLREA